MFGIFRTNYQDLDTALGVIVRHAALEFRCMCAPDVNVGVACGNQEERKAKEAVADDEDDDDDDDDEDEPKKEL